MPQECNPVSGYYETWWISPEGEVYDAVDRGVPGHCAWLRERFGIPSREEACDLGWIRVGWNMQQFYVQGRPERIEEARPEIEQLLLRHPMVVRVLVDDGSPLSPVLTPEEFFSYRPSRRR